MPAQPAPATSSSPLAALLAVLVGLGLARAAARTVGLGVLLAVVVATVGALTVGVALLRLVVLH